MAAPPLLSSPTSGLAGALNSDCSPHIIHRGQVTVHEPPVGPTMSRCPGRPESTSRQPNIPNSGETAQNDSLSWMQERGRYGPHLSKDLAQFRISLLQRQHGKLEGSSRCASTKIESRISNLNQDVRTVKSCSVGPACSEDWVHNKIPIKPRNSKPGSAGQRRSASSVGPSFSDELRRFLTFNNNVSSLEERIQRLEKENMEMLLEIWRSKLQFARVKRELRCELFKLKMKRISMEFNNNLCEFNGLREEEIVFKFTKEWMVQKFKELQFIVVLLWGKVTRVLDVLESIGLVIASLKFFKFLV